MNKIFKIVFNAARGKMMVVNEATSSVQTGKKAAVTVAVVAALASGVANAGIEITNDNKVVNVTELAQTVENATMRYSGFAATTDDVNVSVADGVTISVEGNQVSLASPSRMYGASTHNGKALVVGGDVSFDFTATSSEVRVLRENGGDLTLKGDANITVEAGTGFVDVLEAWSGNDLTVNGDVTANVTTTGGRIIGIQNYDSKSTIHVNGDVHLTLENSATSSNYTQGILATMSTTQIDGDLTMFITGGAQQTYGIDVQTNPQRTDLTKVTVGGNTVIDTSGAGEVWGVRASGAPGGVTFKGDVSLTVESSSSTAVGLQSTYGSDVTVEGHTTISTTAKNSAWGLTVDTYNGGWAQGGEYAANATLNGLTVTATSTDEGDAFAVTNEVKTGVVDSTDGKLIVNGDLVATANSTNGKATALYAEGAGTTSMSGSSVALTANGANAQGVNARYGAVVDLGSTDTSLVSINVGSNGSSTEGNLLMGIQAREEGTKVTVNGQKFETTVTAKDTAYGVLVQGNAETQNTGTSLGAIAINAKDTVIKVSSEAEGESYGLVAFAQGRLDVNGDLAVTGAKSILARGDSVININDSGKNTVKLDGDIDFAYHKTSGTTTDASVNLNLSNAESYLRGNIYTEANGAPSDDLVKMTGMKMALSNGATWYASGNSLVNQLTVDGGVVSINGGDNGATVTVDTKLAGSSATIALGSDADKFVFTGLAENNSLKSIELTQAGATADTMSVDEAEAAAELYADNVVSVDDQGQETALKTTFVVAEGEVGGEIVVGADGTVEQAVNAKTEALADKVTLAPQMITRILMNDVRKRMGDIRAAEGTHGVWARYNGGQMSGAGTDADFHMVQVGIDTVPVVDAPRFGVAFSYAQTEAEDGYGSTDMDSFSLAFYGTKMYDNGMFVDVIGRMATMDTDMVNASMKGKMDNVALSLSGEFGWRFDVTDSFFVEPSVEATYTYTNADKFTMGNGTYELEATDSLVGRAGFAAGFKCPANKGDVYVRAAVVHEFMGDTTMNSWTASGIQATPVVTDGKDTWVEFGIGANFNVNKNTYVYADIERTEGATMDEDWRANVGVRFAF